jgi:hypothetical protein
MKTARLVMSLVAWMCVASGRLMADFDPYSPRQLRAAVAFSSYFVSCDSDTRTSEAELPREFGPNASVRFSRGDDQEVLQLKTSQSMMKWIIPREITGVMGDLQIVAAADLNGDNRPDLVLVLNSTGNGLGGSYSSVIVLLSSTTSYNAAYFRSLFFDLSKFEILEGQHVGVLQATLMGASEGLDGKAHHYVVHRRLLVTRDSLPVDSKFEPKWIMYSFRPNHTETEQISAQQKREIAAKSLRNWDNYNLGGPN